MHVQHNAAILERSVPWHVELRRVQFVDICLLVVSVNDGVERGNDSELRWGALVASYLFTERGGAGQLYAPCMHAWRVLTGRARR